MEPLCSANWTYSQNLMMDAILSIDFNEITLMKDISRTTLIARLHLDIFVIIVRNPCPYDKNPCYFAEAPGHN